MKVVVEINLPGVDDLEPEDEWFPYGEDRISIDNAYLTLDPDDDSFYLFKLVRVEQ